MNGRKINELTSGMGRASRASKASNTMEFHFALQISRSNQMGSHTVSGGKKVRSAKLLENFWHQNFYVMK